MFEHFSIQIPHGLFKAALATLLFFISGCGGDKYKITIKTMAPKRKIESQEMVEITAKDDTAAFRHATRHYWSKKYAALKTNKLVDGDMGVPYFFLLQDKKEHPIRFEAEVAERLTADIVQYFKDSVLPEIDTITPLSKRPTDRTPKIY